MKRKILTVILIYLMPSFCFAQESKESSVAITDDVIIIKAEGIAFLGSGLNPYDAKTFALNDAKRNALNQAGTYIESHTEVVNYVLTKDEIISITGSFIQVKELSTKNEIVQGDFAIRVFIEAKIDRKLLDETIKKVRNDVSLQKQFEALKKRNDELEKQITTFQRKGTAFTKEEVRAVVLKISASKWFEKAINVHLHEKPPNLKLAIQFYQEAVKEDPNFYIAYNNVGAIHLDQAEYERAFENFTEGIAAADRKGEKFAILYANRSLTLYRQNKCEEALKDASVALQIDHESINGYEARGTALGCLTRYQESVKDFDEAIRLSKEKGKLGELGRLYSNRALSRFNSRNHIGAIADWDRACKMNVEDACEEIKKVQVAYDDPKSTIKVIEALHGMVGEAIDLKKQQRGCQPAIDILEEAVHVCNFLMEWPNRNYEAEFDDAILTLSQYKGYLYLELGAANHFIGKDLYENRKIEKAMPFFEESKKSYQNGSQLISLAAFPRSEKFRSTLSWHKKVEADALLFLYGAYVNQANMYDEEGKFDKAIEYYAKAIELNPNLESAYYNRGMAYFHSRQYGLAIPDFKKVIQLKPDYAEAYLHLGMVYTNTNQIDEACKNLKKAVELKPLLETPEVKKWFQLYCNRKR